VEEGGSGENVEEQIPIIPFLAGRIEWGVKKVVPHSKEKGKDSVVSPDSQERNKDSE